MKTDGGLRREKCSLYFWKHFYTLHEIRQSITTDIKEM